MISIDKEYFSNPYYFLLREKEEHYSLYFSSEKTLTEARKKDKVIKIPKDKLKKVEKYLEKLLKQDEKKSTEEMSGEIEELVNADGNLMNSKIPILDPRLHPRKTMDQTIAMARQTNDPVIRGYRNYYGYGMGEADMSKAFGYEETKDLDGEETYEYFKDELEMDPEEAKERTEQQGKDPSGERDEKSKFKNDSNFVSKQILPEIQKQKMIKVLEDMLTKKKDTSDSDISSKEKKELPLLVRNNLKTLLKNIDKHGISKKEIIKLIQGE
jgi:hypothetical protein